MGVAHSKMTSQSLESAVLAFFSGKINVLVCTSIVESGLDVQNANTMIINGAQNFGLSQLYQIRGRVGRGGVRAFCFLCVHSPDRWIHVYVRILFVCVNV